MLRQIFSILLVAGISQIATAQSVEFEGGKTHTYVMGHSGSTDCYLIFRNHMGKSAKFVYNKIQDDYPSAWWVSFCDNVNCFANLVANDTFATIADSAEAEFKITVTPNGKADTATVKYEFYEEATPNVKDTLTFIFVVQWGAGSQDLVTSTYRVYPNPVSDQLHVPFATPGTKVYITSLTGDYVKEITAADTKTNIMVSDLQAGFYFVSYMNNGVPVKLRFLKN
ncbi:MAG: T9SS type A sorting domain-containing protein [Bacteroidetes bacterium]|nr:T9SS type A sorting domain-containing protein [Bacteroidota bacterium]